MRNGFRWMAIGLTAGLTAAVLLTGCAREDVYKRQIRHRDKKVLINVFN